MMLDNLREVKERLRAFLPKSRADMHAALEANFDVDFLEQQLTHKVLSYSRRRYTPHSTTLAAGMRRGVRTR